MKKIILFFILPILVIFSIQFKYVKSQNLNHSDNVVKNNENILIILDSSYSMDDKINGEKKIDIAKRTINNVLSQLSPDIPLGLRVYGHKDGFFGIGGCKASELIVPISPNSSKLISQEVSKIKPVGWTPITYSIDQALKNDFSTVSGQKRIILVSDGMENCGESPCDYVVRLIKNKVDIKIDTIGFALDEPEATSQLKCAALATKGVFYPAENAKDLENSLIKSLNITKEVQGVIVK